ncbi:MAG: type II toxin-antitoxin system RelE/ParE family toxin [Candidatus Doudnabacteria bacterium]|nr:type II toxin-antitoxin system RelE/ParE family toxin [Candidatus Doudnabacteria bacterium]
MSAFKIAYHHQVVSLDLPKLSSEWKAKIKRAVEERLTIHPDLYGRPLRRSLKGYRKLRVGDYRVIFKIEKNTVKILIIEHRSVVYSRIDKRVKSN